MDVNVRTLILTLLLNSYHKNIYCSRTDGVLPLNLPRWNRGAECFKSFNRQQKCLRALHCTEEDGPYCKAFTRDGMTAGNGKDLATVVYYRHVEEDDPCEWTLNLAGKLKC